MIHVKQGPCEPLVKGRWHLNEYRHKSAWPITAIKEQKNEA